MTTYTFRKTPNGPIDLIVEAESTGSALEVANRKLVWSGEIPGFYAWNDEGHPGDFTAMIGGWD